MRQHDRDRFQTALFAPARHQEALFALYAFNYEVARVRESVREPMLGQIRLQWWREAIATAYEGGAPRHHEAAEAITDTIRNRSLSRAHFDRLIDARERDLDDTPPATLAELEGYAEGTSARLVMLALEVLGAATPAALEAAGHVGIAYALSGLLRALPAHAAAGRSFIPTDVAAQVRLGLAVGRNPSSPFRGEREGPSAERWEGEVGIGERSGIPHLTPTLSAPGGREGATLAPDRGTSPALLQACAAIAAAASRHLAAARALRAELPRAALPALLPARIAANALRRLERAGFDPFQGAAIAGDPLQSWRLAYAALTRRF